MLEVKETELRGVSETLLIPLYFRALELKESQPIIRDEQAAQLVARIPYDFSRFDKASMDRVFTLLRARHFDDCAKAFLKRYPAGVVVEIGCGLDDRLSRVDNGKVEWYDLDLPEVIKLREKLIGEAGRRRRIAGSVLNPDWMEAVGKRPGGSCLLLAEGVFPYLEPTQVKLLFLMLRQQYPGCEIVFDVLSPFMIRLKRLDPGVRQAANRLRWGVSDDREVEGWAEGMQLLESWNYFQEDEPRLGPARWMRWFPPLKQGARVLRYQLGKPG